MYILQFCLYTCIYLIIYLHICQFKSARLGAIFVLKTCINAFHILDCYFSYVLFMRVPDLASHFGTAWCTVWRVHNRPHIKIHSCTVMYVTIHSK
jgi:hypothetical protein